MMDELSLPPDVLNTNFVLDPLLIKQAHITVNDLNSQVLALEDEVAHAKAEIRRKTVRRRTLGKLRARQRALRKTIAQYTVLLSPMRTVPPEILVEIFLCCLPPRGTSICAGDAPLLVTHVCRQWRYVAINARHLWTSLSMGGVGEGAAIVANVSPFGLDPVLVTQIWLTRSGRLPLDIQLMIPDWTPKLREFSSAAVQKRDIVTRYLKVHVHRWRHFKAAVFDCIREVLPSNRMMRAPMLESFHVCRSRCSPGGAAMPEFGQLYAPRMAECVLDTLAITLSRSHSTATHYVGCICTHPESSTWIDVWIHSNTARFWNRST